MRAALVLMCSVVLASQANAGTISLSATVDGRVRDVDGLFFGPVLVAGDRLETFLNSGGFETRSALEFSLGTIPANSVITSVTLDLEALLAIGMTEPINAFGYVGDGVLAVGDVFGGSAIGSFVPQPGSNTAVLDAAFVQSLVDNGDSFFGINLRTSSTATHYTFNDMEAGPALEPILTIVYEDVTAVPEPTALAIWFLFGIAGSGMAMRRRETLATVVV